MDYTEGKPYIFISYSHKDSDVVLTILNFLKENNTNLWYDGGIEAGSEWPDYIAQKIVDCDRFICFISGNYTASQNCTRELNFAISEKKKVLSVYIDDSTRMSAGMRMQLGSYQSLFVSKYASVDRFCKTLAGEKFVRACMISDSTNLSTEKIIEKIQNEKADEFYRNKNKKSDEPHKSANENAAVFSVIQNEKTAVPVEPADKTYAEYIAETSASEIILKPKKPHIILRILSVVILLVMIFMDAVMLDVVFTGVYNSGFIVASVVCLAVGGIMFKMWLNRTVGISNSKFKKIIFAVDTAAISVSINIFLNIIVADLAESYIAIVITLIIFNVIIEALNFILYKIISR